MTVRRVLAQAHIGDQEKFANILANGAQRLLNDAVLVVGVGSVLVLFRRNTEKQNPADARLLCVAGKLDGIVDRYMVLTGHRADFVADVLSRAHEDRVDHGFRRQSRFTNEVAKAFGAPQPAHAMYWE